MDNLDSDKLNELIKYYIYLYLITTVIKENYT